MNIPLQLQKVNKTSMFFCEGPVLKKKRGVIIYPQPKLHASMIFGKSL